MGVAVAQWLRYCAGSIPDGVIGIFQWHNPSDRTMALGSTQPPTEMSTRNISWGKGGLCVRLTILPPSCAVVMKSGNLNFLEPSGPLQACNGTALPFVYFNNKPLHVSSSLAAHHQEDQLCINSNWYSHALYWLAAAGRFWEEISLLSFRESSPGSSNSLLSHYTYYTVLW